MASRKAVRCRRVMLCVYMVVSGFVQSADGAVVGHAVVVVAVESVADRQLGGAVPFAVGVGHAAECVGGVAAGRDEVVELPDRRGVAQQGGAGLLGPAVGVVVVVDKEDAKAVVHLGGVVSRPSSRASSSASTSRLVTY